MNYDTFPESIDRLLITICKYFGSLMVFFLTCWLGLVTCVLMINMANNMMCVKNFGEIKNLVLKFDNLFNKIIVLEGKLNKIVEFINKK